MTERAAGQIVPLGRGCTIAYAEPAIERLPVNMVETRPSVMVAVPRLYERLYARVISTVEAGPGLRKRIFYWARGLGLFKDYAEIDQFLAPPAIALVVPSQRRNSDAAPRVA